jgi:ribosomal subunit interface protein
MDLKPQITFKNIPHSITLEKNILQRIKKIEQFYTHLVRCDVVIEQTQKHKQKGKLFQPRIVVSVPGDTITVNHASHEDPYIAVRHAFEALQRRLKAFAKKQRGEVKTHDTTLHGNITRLFNAEAFGFIETEHEEYYFTNFNVNNARFDDLKVGLMVEFIPNEGDGGLLAHRVNVIKRKYH